MYLNPSFLVLHAAARTLAGVVFFLDALGVGDGELKIKQR